MRLEGKRVLVTGSSRGVGAAIARVFAREGASVVVNYNVSEADARSVVESILREGGDSFAIKANVSDPASVREMFSTAKEKLGGLDVLVNNAGAADGGIWNAAVAEITPEMWNRVFSVDLVGTFLCTQGGATLMPEGGKVVNVASTPALVGDDGGIVYASVKGSVVSLTRMLARALAPKISVNCLVLGAIETGWIQWLKKEEVQDLKRNIPMGRLGSPDDVARAALFFATRDSDYVTGQTLVVDGGEVMV